MKTVFSKALKEVFKQVSNYADVLSDEGRKQLRIQGHYASGALDKSFETKLKGDF